jgi:hypothetical protein
VVVGIEDQVVQATGHAAVPSLVRSSLRPRVSPS